MTKILIQHTDSKREIVEIANESIALYRMLWQARGIKILAYTLTEGEWQWTEEGAQITLA